jgi:hypothetical protein
MFRHRDRRCGDPRRTGESGYRKNLYSGPKKFAQAADLTTDAVRTLGRGWKTRSSSRKEGAQSDRDDCAAPRRAGGGCSGRCRHRFGIRMNPGSGAAEAQHAASEPTRHLRKSGKSASDTARDRVHTPGPDHESPGRDHKSPGPDHKSPERDHKSPGPDHESPGPDHESPGRDQDSPGPDHESPSLPANLD